MKRSFSKYSGCGNDFILMDDRDVSLSKEAPFLISSQNSVERDKARSKPRGLTEEAMAKAIADEEDRSGKVAPDRIPDEMRKIASKEAATVVQKLCQRKTGIGADGVLLVQTSDRADVCMRIFNADGSEAEMCGNGLRCLAAWLFRNNVKPGCKTYSISVGETVYQAEERDGEIGIQMPKPKTPPVTKELEWGEGIYTCHWIDSGVPHAVAVVENLEALPLHEIGPFVRCHPVWGKRGANATFTKRLGPSRWKMRTFERGVEAETQACGTGGMAVACLAELLFEEQSPISVEMASSETLLFSRCGDGYWMQGPARFVFEGTIVL